MAAETAVLLTIGSSLASGLLEEVVKKAIGAASESSKVAGLKSAIFRDLEPDLRLLKDELVRLNYVLTTAQRIDPIPCDHNNLLLLWLRDVKEASFYADNLLDEIAYEKIRRQLQIQKSAVAKLLLRSETSSLFRVRISGKVKNCVSLIAEIHKKAETTLNLAKLAGKASNSSQRSSTTTSENLREIRENPDTSIVLGRQADEKQITTKLCSSDNNCDLTVVAIVGRSGVGKTTLARMVYDNDEVYEHFGKRTWIFVSDQFQLERFLDEMLQSVTGESHNLSNKGAMEEKLQQSLKGEKGYLLVLDDVWNTDEQLWKSVESSLLRISRFTRCVVLVTTQCADVARIMCYSSLIHELEDLGDADAWALFKKISFANKTQEQVSYLEDVGRRILCKCRGLPLAIKTLGSLLGSMNDRSEWESVERSEIWGLSLEQSNVMPWLLISFHHLPNPAIKQCFVHCSIIIEKGGFVPQSELIQAWMAQGFIQSTTERDTNTSMEDVGDTYVSKLVSKGLLQMDIRSGGRCYLWMHDLVHDLTCFISKGTSWSPMEASETEHLRICGDDNYHLKGKTLSEMRTLICTRATVAVHFVAQARFLRDLRLMHCGLKKVPNSIGRLKHLRYLSLRGNPFRDLPESITSLFNLQMLDLEECDNFVELPRKIIKLVNLRHILTSEKGVKMPNGMGQLIRLRTLPRIGLGVKEGFEIKELKSLTFLSGNIEISGLEHISCKEDVVEASLKTKERIRNLSLWWDEQAVVASAEEIMDELLPHSDLKGILVGGFSGKRLSSWLLDMSNLTSLVLESCNSCVQLPALGQLGFLEEICISGMASLEVIGVEFYDSDDSKMTRRKILFPRLKRLLLEDMQKLRDWIQPLESVYYEIFPYLEKLEIHNCPLLMTAPTCFQSLLILSIWNINSGKPVMMILTNSSNLTRLRIHGVEQLTSLSHPLSTHSKSLKTISISNCKELIELCPTFQCMISLENLKVEECDSLASFPDIEALVSLRTLEIWDCRNLQAIHGLESCVLIEKLHLYGNSKLNLIPDLRNLSCLKWLVLVDFSQQTSIPEWLSCLRNLGCLDIGGFNEEVEQLNGAANLPKCLKRLGLRGWTKLDSVPSEVQYLNQLECLALSKFEGIEERFPDWVGEILSLQELYLEGCNQLKYLPSPDVMQRLTQLRKLHIRRCVILEERCRKEGGEEWHKISHIQDVRLQ